MLTERALPVDEGLELGLLRTMCAALEAQLKALKDAPVAVTVEGQVQTDTVPVVDDKCCGCC